MLEKSDMQKQKQQQQQQQQRVLTINDFLFDAKMDHFNLFKILKYIEGSDIVRKVL